MIHEQTKKFEWDASEVDHREKTVDWYWALGIAVVVGCVLCIIAKNYLLAILIALGGLLLAFYGNDRPMPVHVEISERGIKMNDDLYTHETIKSFWMYVDHKKRNRLSIITSRTALPERIVMLPDDISAREIRAYLLRFAEEKETNPSLLNVLAETVGL